MLNVFSREADRPTKLVIGNKAEVTEVTFWKQLRIRFDKRSQYCFRNDFGAHRTVKKKLEIVLGPGRRLFQAWRSWFFLRRRQHTIEQYENSYDDERGSR